MRFPILQAIFRREMLDMFRDRRTMISMVAVPLLVIPLMLTVMTRVISRVEKKAGDEAKNLAIAVHVTTPSVRAAIEKLGLKLNSRDDFKEAIEKKEIGAAVQETAGTPPQLLIFVDRSNPTSSAAGDLIRTALTDLKDQQIRENLRNSGIPETVLNPFTIKRENIAGERKMAGAAWGSMLGYVLLLLMFTGGMYPVIDMTAGEKERKTLEAFLASPAARREIVVGKTLAAMTAIFLTAALTLGSMVFSLKNANFGGRSAEVFGTIPLDTHTLTLIIVTLIPLAIFAASVMFAIALFARSFKEGQSYLTPLALLVIFPALMGGFPGFEITPVLCLIPIFNASQIIRGILLGDVSMTNFAITTAANLVYAGIAAVIATRTFENEKVLFRS
ncbi:MAG TPA: ABC transporter permease [Bryobacteraceae bacterium]|jgi:sodium transport system permease protein|nr:ABC transporter permease [Bryobacteraceae bacterium]